MQGEQECGLKTVAGPDGVDDIDAGALTSIAPASPVPGPSTANAARDHNKADACRNQGFAFPA